ncbi:hypothetical protein [Kitasatospora sp. NPDC086791]|jgi:hypothetical protein|uniref:hypothetical protein n=1 Tax=Kitasatospora sp. NPDC086791 TaxID=3155178 RepID=UPI003422A6F7
MSRIRTARDAARHAQHTHLNATDLRAVHADEPGGSRRHIGWTFNTGGDGGHFSHGWVLTNGTISATANLSLPEARDEARLNARTPR